MMKKIEITILAICLFIGIGAGTAYAAAPNTDMIQGINTTHNIRTGTANLSSATPISLGTTLNESITESQQEHVYKFTMSKSGRVTLDMVSYMKYYTILIYDNSGEWVWYTDCNTWNENLKYRQDIHEVDLISGIYYLRITGYRTKEDRDSSTGIYKLKTIFTDAEESYKEYNNDFNQAQIINPNSTIKGQIASNDSCDIYKFSLSKSGRVNLNVTSYMEYNSIIIYDSAGTQLWYTDWNYWNENLKCRQDIYNIDLAKGTYYLRVSGQRNCNNWYGSSTGNYILRTVFTDAKENIIEPNNDFSTAYVINFNSKLNGQIAINDRYDIYKFSLPNSMDIKLSITSYMKYYTVSIYNSAGKSIWYTDWNEWNENVGYRSDIHKIELSAGTYYMKITGYKHGENTGSTGIYNFSLGTFSLISNATVVPIKDVTYTGSYRQPAVTVKYNGNILRNGVDYALSYRDNYSIGKATVTITGIGNYSGEKQATFKILPKKVSLQSVKNTAKRTVTIRWKTDYSVSGYEVYRSPKKKSGYKKIYTVKSAYYDELRNWKLKKKKTYYYKVRAYKIVNGKRYYGAFSKVKSVKIKK